MFYRPCLVQSLGAAAKGSRGSRRLLLGGLLAALVLVPLAVAPAAAANRVVVLPVAVGGGEDPDPVLMTALAEGLKQNPQWAVEQGDSLVGLIEDRTPPLSDEDLSRMAGELDDIGKKIKANAGSTTVAALDRNLVDLAKARTREAPGAKADALGYRGKALLVAAMLDAKETKRAQELAQETRLLYPGYKPESVPELPQEARTLLATDVPSMGVALKLVTRPEGCEVWMGGASLGKAPVEVRVLPEVPYYPEARCEKTAGGDAMQSAPKKVVVAANANERQEVLDAEFERSFAAEKMRRLRFASSQERRQLEDSYARRVAERFNAEVVVLASVGELSGADWLSARLYLRSGYMNRQGLVRLEAKRANALGRFLATGKDVPGVLKPEEAGALVAASQAYDKRAERVADPWYTDIAGWALLGTGTVSFVFGQWGSSRANDKKEIADGVRGDSERQQRLYREAESTRFWSGIGTIGGILLASTGAILLMVPEYNDPSDEYFGFAPTLLPGGGGLTMAGRF